MTSRDNKRVPNERAFAATGKVSVWVGDFASEDALLDYIEDAHGFGADFGCVLLHRRELSVEPQAKPIRELIEGFSWSEQFVGEVAGFAGADMPARCAVLSHASDYTLLGITPKPDARLRFLGVASFGDEHNSAEPIA
jgi:hypothetical protein